MHSNQLDGVYLSEKQITKRATHKNVEQFYTSIDIDKNITSFDANTGFTFEYPFRWITDESQDKRIGIRRLNVIPSSHTFQLRVICIYMNESGATESLNPRIGRLSITYKDDLISIMHEFCKIFQPLDASGNPIGELRFEYDERKHRVNLCYVDTTGNIGGLSIQGMHLMDEYVSITNYRECENGIIEFMRMLNVDDCKQIVNDAYSAIIHDLHASIARNQQYDDDTYLRANLLDIPLYSKWFDVFCMISCPDIGKIITIDDVWNRKDLYIHASFSNSNHKIIGKNNDFYTTPSVWFPAPTNESSFYIQFSTDGNQKILIRYCTFDLQFCFAFH